MERGSPRALGLSAKGTSLRTSAGTGLRTSVLIFRQSCFLCPCAMSLNNDHLLRTMPIIFTLALSIRNLANSPALILPRSIEMVLCSLAQYNSRHDHYQSDNTLSGNAGS
jgi:hypothetical protein